MWVSLTVVCKISLAICVLFFSLVQMEERAPEHKARERYVCLLFSSLLFSSLLWSDFRLQISEFRLFFITDYSNLYFFFFFVNSVQKFQKIQKCRISVHNQQAIIQKFQKFSRINLRTENEKPRFFIFQILDSHNNIFTKPEFNSSAKTDNQQAIIQKFQKFRNAETILRTENKKTQILFFQILDSHNNRFTKPELILQQQQTTSKQSSKNSRNSEMQKQS